jgi:flavin reductase (DIM6/NTAB) family NADH-FMN oxidoreductase RutF
MSGGQTNRSRVRQHRISRHVARLRPLPLEFVYQFIEPGPVVLLSTWAKTRGNVMPMSWHMMLEFEPPQLACICSSANHSFESLRSTGECVIGIPARHLAEKVVKLGNTSGAALDKIRAFGLVTKQASQVSAPLLLDCFVNLECRVIDRKMITRYNMFLLEVAAAWRDPKQSNPKMIHHGGYGRFIVDGSVMRLPSLKP